MAWHIYGVITEQEVRFIGCTKGDIPSGAFRLQTVTHHPEAAWVKWCLRHRRTLKDTKALASPLVSYFTNPTRLNRLLRDEAVLKLQADTLAGFLDFNTRNSHILPELVADALAEKAAGREVYSAQEHIGRVRWGTTDTDRAEDKFKINSCWSAWYSRLIQMEEPGLIGFFRLRYSLADGLVWKGRTWADFTEEHADDLHYEVYEELPDGEWEYND